jgi:hypothetical protein
MIMRTFNHEGHEASYEDHEGNSFIVFFVKKHRDLRGSCL